LLLRYRARNFTETLNQAEQASWQAHCTDRLCEAPAEGRLDLRGYAERIAALETGADERARALLARLRDYALSIAPDCAASAGPR